MAEQLQGGGDKDSQAVAFADTVWNAELDALARLRALRDVEGPEFAGETAKERAYSGEASGLAFSGGGIRSATFNLGIAQALAKYGLLRRMDYLSTVSGGGYIGSWLSAWIKHQGFDAVEARLPVEHTKTEQPADAELETSPVSFLRAFSNYLTPQLGLLSADTWAAVATYTRNLFLNLLVLIGALSAILLLPRLFVQGADLIGDWNGPWAFGLALATLALAIFFMGANVIAIEAHRSGHRAWYTSQKWVQFLVAVPLFLAAWLFANVFWFADAGDGIDQGISALDVGVWAGGSALFYFGCWFFGWIYLKFLTGKESSHKPRSRWDVLLFTAPIAGAVGGVLALGVVAAFVLGRVRFFPGEVGQEWSLIHTTVLGAPGIILVFIFTAVLHIGLMGRSFDEANREWWSRLGGWLLIYGITWLGFTAMAFYAPVVIIWIGGIAAAALGAGWLGGSIGGVLFERKAAGSIEESPSKLLGLVRAAVPHIFVVGLVAILAFLLHVALDGKYLASDIQAIQADGTDVASVARTCSEFWPPARIDDERNSAMSFSNLMLCHSARGWLSLEEGPLTGILFLTLALGSLLLSWRIDINQFSMHLFYRNRLIRAYLGASNPYRDPQAFTGFDPCDDFPLADLLPEAEKPYNGPYHLINVNLNLVKGEELAWQQRKGASFLMSPLYTGFAGQTGGTFDGPGFRPTSGYEMGDRGISLGMAMAISGAAVSPSMGQGTTAALAFLLTVFDARLGWWLGNPMDERTWRRIGPDVGLFRLLSELFSYTNDRSKYVYLSDGGHFENLGIYELVRRRCRFIISSDGGADTQRIFGGLANAIRKCRTDFGVPISLDLKNFRFGQGDKYSKVHCAVGTIHYDAVDPGAPNGTLLFLKTALTGDEPADVLNYKAANPTFPNQSTADQFFDEAQFESYRALGYHTVEKVFENVDPDAIRDMDRAELCEALEAAWCSSIPEPTGGGG